MSGYDYLRTGLGNVGNYQVSGIPYATGSLTISNSSVTEIVFPNVTRFIVVKNVSTEDLRVGFSENGVNGSNYFILGQRESFSGDLRVTKLYLRGDTDNAQATVVAGLTGIHFSNLTSSWSGSLGVG